jgi:hypothetical protein
MGIILSPNIFIRVQYLIIFLFSIFFSIFKLLQILGFMGCIAPMCQKLTSLYRAFNKVMLVGMWKGIYQHILSFIPYSKVYDVVIYLQKMIGLKYTMQQC